MTKLDTLLQKIAKKHLHLETLETRNSDSLDFSEQAVWAIKDALDEAFKAGIEVGVEIAFSGKK